MTSFLPHWGMCFLTAEGPLAWPVRIQRTPRATQDLHSFPQSLPAHLAPTAKERTHGFVWLESSQPPIWHCSLGGLKGTHDSPFTQTEHLDLCLVQVPRRGVRVRDVSNTFFLPSPRGPGTVQPIPETGRLYLLHLPIGSPASVSIIHTGLSCLYPLR